MRSIFVKKFQLVLIFIVVIILQSCGYHTNEYRSNLPNWMRSIYIKPFSNNSNEYLLSQWITSELREEFLLDSFFNVTSEENSDVTLHGNIKSVYTTGLSYIRYDQTVERKISVSFSVSILKTKTGEKIWETSDIVKEEGFYVGEDIMETEGFKNEALKKISVNVAEIIHHRVSDIF